MSPRRVRASTASGPSELAGDRVPVQPVRPSDDGSPAWDAATCALATEPKSARTARDFATTTLRDWDLDDLCDDVELVVCELVTNALRASGRVLQDDVRGAGEPPPPTGLDSQRAIQLKLVRKARYVMCLVADPSDEAPSPQELGDGSEFLNDAGRGLYLVQVHCHRWGWARLRDGGKVVWALFHASG